MIPRVVGGCARRNIRTSFPRDALCAQRDFQPLPVPWSWAPLREVLLQTCDRRHTWRGHRARDSRRELHRVGAWSLLQVLCIKFLHNGAGLPHRGAFSDRLPSSTPLLAVRRIVPDLKWFLSCSLSQGMDPPRVRLPQRTV